MEVDPTTLADLQIFGESGNGGGIFGLVDETRTEPGRRALRRRFESPDADAETIRDVQSAVGFFSRHPEAFPVDGALLERVRSYLGSNIVLTGGRGPFLDMAIPWFHAVRYRDAHREIRRGIQAFNELERLLREAVHGTLALDPPDTVGRPMVRIREICDESAGPSRSVLPPSLLSRDRLLRDTRRELLAELVELIAELDCLRAMGRATARLGWSMPEIVESDHFRLEAEGVYHPFVQDPVKNPLEIDSGEPVIFLTGPNMAGKTTYLRTAALIVLLAQVGMGVPASFARCTPVEVLLTSLNPADDLRTGTSFFLAEVRRVREAAVHLAAGRRCFILFDEVFKGTNLRDALEATREVILGFAKAEASGFIFSSHLLELVERLESEPGIRFQRFEGSVVGGRARFAYTVRPGVSDERLGLQLLVEEEVPDLIALIDERSR